MSIAELKRFRWMIGLPASSMKNLLVSDILNALLGFPPIRVLAR
jgi:hypothetical protein